MPAILLMLALMVFGLAVSAAADVQDSVTVRENNLEITGAELRDGRYTKVYDGKSDVAVSVKNGVALEGAAAGDDVTLKVVSAKFNSANAADASLITVEFALEGADAYKYAQPKNLELPARILPRELEWAGDAAISITYRPDVSSYQLDREAVEAVLPALKPVAGLESLIQSLTFTVTDVNALPAVNASETPYSTQAAVRLSNSNFTVAPVTVQVTVNPILIQNIVWTGNNSWTYGEACPVEVAAYDSSNKAYDILSITCDKEGFALGNAGSYTLVASLTDTSGNYRFAAADTAKTSYDVTILPKKFTVSMNDLSVIGDEKTLFRISVGGGLPEEVLSLISYTVEGSPFNGTSKYGSFIIKAALPVGNYSFDTASQTNVNELTAVLTVKRQQKLFPVVNEDGEVIGNVILSNPNGFSDGVQATVVALKGYPDIVKNNRYNQVFRITVTGAADGETFTLLIPLFDSILGPRNDQLTADHLSVYESATGTLTSAMQAGKGYTVTLGEGYYQVEGFLGVGETTFVISPDYHTPFFYTAPGIVLLILLVIGLLILLFYIGLILRRKLDNRQNPVIVVDTDGVLPAYVPVQTVEIPERAPVDVDAAIDEDLNGIAGSLNPEAAAKEPAPADETEVQEAVDESLKELKDEAAEIELDQEEEPADEEESDHSFEELADSMAETLAETVEADDGTEVDQNAVDQAVAEAMEEATTFNDSADTEDAVDLEEAPAEELEEELAAEGEEEAEETFAEIDEEAIEVLAQETAPEEFTEEENPDETEEVVEETVEEPEISGEETEEMTDSAAEETEEAEEEGTSEEIEEIPEEPEEETEPAEETDSAEESVPDTAVAVEAAQDSEEETEAEDEGDEEDDESVEAIAVVEDAFAFGSAADPSTFIDVKENPEAYQEMLERERRGEIRIVSRYKKSFTAKLSQSLGNVQDYYSELKNALLSYKGVKNRISWNYESFNKGRVHVAKMDAKTRSLYLYLAIDPELLADTKYNFVDVSGKRKYATTPVLMKIKGERKFKHALELITMLCGDQMALPHMENESVDYKVPRMTIDEMVEAGIMKHQAGYIVLTPEPEAVAVSAEVTEPESAAEAETAVENAAAETVEETPVEETMETVDVAEETPVEETVETVDAAEETTTVETETTEGAPAEDPADSSKISEEEPSDSQDLPDETDSKKD